MAAWLPPQQQQEQLMTMVSLGKVAVAAGVYLASLQTDTL
jgi:hypothetical protein